MTNKKKKATHALPLRLIRKGLPKSKRSQEEMVGFALIIIVVAVILMVFLAISLRKGNREPIESYKVEGFINAMLQYNTECEDRKQGFIQVKNLIYYCYEEKECLGGSDSCEIINETLREIIHASWNIGEDTPLKGYLLNITIDGRQEHTFEAGNKTYNSLGTLENLPKGVEIIFVAYY